MGREVYPAIVSNVDDPEQRGRIRVKSQALLAEGVEINEWIEPCFPFAGTKRGWFFLPDVDDAVEIEAVVGEAGDDSPGLGLLIDPSFRWRAVLYPTTDDIPEEFRGDGYGKRFGFKTRGGALIFDEDVLDIILQAAKGGHVRIGTADADEPIPLGKVLQSFASDLRDAIAAITVSVVVPPGGGTITSGVPLNKASFDALKASPIGDGKVLSDVAFVSKSPPS